MAQTINLFEYDPFPLGQISGLPDDFNKSLNQILNRIWNERKRFVPISTYYAETKSKKQNFIDLCEMNSYKYTFYNFCFQCSICHTKNCSECKFVTTEY